MLLIICAAVLALYCLLVQPYNYWKLRSVKQSNPWPLFGDSWRTLFRVMDVAEVVSFYYNSMPNVRYYGIYQFFKPKLVISDPELIRRVTVKDFDHFVDHVAQTNPKSDPLFSKNILNLKGDEWRKMRSTLSAAFTGSKMKIIFGLVSDAAKDFVDYHENQQSQVNEVEMKDAFSRFATDVIATSALGVKVNSLAEQNNSFFQMGKELTEFRFPLVFKMLLLQMFPRIYQYFELQIFRKEVTEFFSNLVHTTVATREAKGIYRPDMIQILMEASKGIHKDKNEDAIKVDFDAGDEDTEITGITQEITTDDMTAQALLFFFAGFDSVSSLLTFATYELAVNGNVQDKLREEIFDTLEKTNGTITYEALSNMKYLDMVVSEALRKWPPFVILGRECTKTYTIKPTLPEEKTLVISKGTGIHIPCYAIHHDPKYFPNPEQFDPERFSAANRSKLTPYTVLGFGQGPRSCLGSRFALMETKIIIFHLLSRLEIVTTERTQIPLKLSKKFGINIRPEKGLWIGFKKLLL
uniref:Cytochrome P450 n=1 Tax=Dendroctonus armandi TaxID=77159 RepID=A0A0M5K0Q7_9CUCU|nr:cytochrome P450 [Dendroctonus armandi]